MDSKGENYSCRRRMKVCDRCKETLSGKEKPTSINGVRFELCELCSTRIINHIKIFSPKKKSILDNLSEAITGK